MFPSIQLTAQGGYESQALSSLVNPAAAFYALTASLTQPIFEGYSLEGALELQRSTYAELLATYRKTVLAAFEDVENALIAAQDSALQEQRQQAVVNAAQHAYQLSEVQLREGTVDISLVLIAEQTLFQNEDTLAQVRLGHLQAAVALFQALGGGWSSADVSKPEQAEPLPVRGEG
jgi:outer membrane protein TolC